MNKETMHSMVHFSIDDFILTFKDLTENEQRYSSLFEQPVFAFLQKMHKKYGAVFSCFCFGRDEKSGFLLENTTRKYREEFRCNAQWLRFGFHGIDNAAVYGDNGGTRVSSRSPEQAAADYAYVVKQLVQIAGETALDTIPRIHFFAGTSECCLKWKNAVYGIRGLLAADDDRCSYYHDDAMRIKLAAENILYDSDRQLLFFRTCIRLEKENDGKALGEKLRTFQGECHVVFTHECYMEQEEMQSRIEFCAQETVKSGKRFGFPLDCCILVDKTKST